MSTATMPSRPGLPSSPSDLAESLANISLDEKLKHVGDESGMTATSAQNEGNETITGGMPAAKDPPPVPPKDEVEHDCSPHEISANLDDINALLEQMRAHFFIIQEKRHAGVFALVENTKGASAGHDASISAQSTPVKAAAAAERAIDKAARGSGESTQSDKNVALDVAMAQLNTYIEHTSEKFMAVERQLAGMDDDEASTLLSSQSRRSSMSSLSSLSSLDSFNGAFGMSFGGSAALEPAELRRRHAELSQEWAKVQGEARTLEAELSGDKYNAVFQGIGEQLEEMMDSLDKALAKCHEFVFAFHRDQDRHAHRSVGESSSHGRDSSDIFSDQDRAVVLQAVKRSFTVKRSSYGPACEQMFASLERGIKQRRTQNGTILRRFAELKGRWRSLRERISRMDKELKSIEAQLSGQTQAEAASQNQTTSSSSPHSLSKSTALGDLSSTTMSQSSPLGNRALQSQPQDGSPISPRNRLQHLAAASAALTRSPSQGAYASRTSAAPADRIARRVSVTLTPPRSERASFSSTVDEASTAHLETVSRRRASIGPGHGHMQSQSFATSSPPVALANKYRLQQNSASSDSSSPMEPKRNDHTLALPRRDSMDAERPGSAAGMYYRPPSSAGHRAEGGMSRIPRLSTGPGQSRAGSVAGDRPGSSMSQASTTSYSRGPSAYDPAAALRLSMQTPEPTILARAQRADLFGAPPSSTRRSTRPPPTRYNAAGRISVSARPSMGDSSSDNGSASAQPQSVSAVKRQSQQWSNGRTTPLSAAALAKIPDAQPTLDGFETPQRRGAGAPRTSINGSVASYRAHRAAVNQNVASGSMASSRVPSIRSGRVTPTFSEGGGSAWGGSAYSGRVSRAGTSIGMGSFEPYRANPNDAIDVEVARVVNSLGVHIERVDPPLPRGVKDLEPKNTTLVKYLVGDKTITVKLLQLHRPAPPLGPAGRGVNAQPQKAKKLLTRVGGGWIDFEQYILSRMGTL